MQSISWEMPGCMNHKLDQDCQKKISTTSDMLLHSLLYWQKSEEELKTLDEGEGGE